MSLYIYIYIYISLLKGPNYWVHGPSGLGIVRPPRIIDVSEEATATTRISAVTLVVIRVCRGDIGVLELYKDNGLFRV